MGIRRSWLVAVWFATLPAWPGTITLIGVGSVPGSAADKSGLSGQITGAPGSIQQNLLGAFGSGIAYTGFGNRYIAVNDRGFSDGVTNPAYIDRFQVFDVTVNPITGAVSPTLVDTRVFTNESGQPFVGQTAAFETAMPARSMRLDPEGVRVGPNGEIFVSDEYGPYIYAFNQAGQRINTIEVPAKFGIENPNADATLELTGNTSGRQANRGMEGLAVAADGTTLFGLMQNPLIQDGALTGTTRDGVNNRILQINLVTGERREYIYQLADGRNNGTNEILGVNDHQLLVLERDGRAGANAQTKRIYLIDINGASDVSATGTTTANGLTKTGTGGFTPVSKSLFLDLLDPAYGLAGASFPEKLEGLAWGPDLADGRHLLLVTSDNDLIQNQPSLFFAFAVDRDLTPGFTAQTINTPFAVPEPSNGLLALAGLSGFAIARRWWRRRRRRR